MTLPAAWPHRNVAFFGGSFDPPHRGHLALAAGAADRFALDLVCFAPAGRQPLKPHGATATFAQRLAMVALACECDPRFAASTLDAPHADGAPNYTVDALRALVASAGGARIFSLVGADSFHTLAQWHDWPALLELSEWIVVSRPGYHLADPEGLTLTAAQRKRIHLLDDVHEDVAASDLRARLAHGDSCADLLSPSVACYIADQGLYR